MILGKTLKNSVFLHNDKILTQLREAGQSECRNEKVSILRHLPHFCEVAKGYL